MSHCSGISGGLVERWHVYHLLSFSRSVMPDSLWPHGLQHARLPRPSPSPGACSNTCPLSQWCHPTILSSIITFSSCLQAFPASRSFLMSWLFTSGGQSIYHHWVVRRLSTPTAREDHVEAVTRHSHPSLIQKGDYWQGSRRNRNSHPCPVEWEAPPWVSMEADELPH